MPIEAHDDNSLAGLETALPALRPELHRYCARMTGSVIDGEDVLQDTLLAASRAIRQGTVVDDLRPWLFRIAHNTALNHHRSRKSDGAMKDDFRRQPQSFIEMPTRSDVADALRPYLRLTPKQRSTVILRDVLGYSAAEVATLTESSVDSVKSALHRGRSLLKEERAEDDTRHEPLSPQEKERLAVYAAHFNAHDFDRLREMLSAEVRLELVDRDRRTGRERVGGYYKNYSKQTDWLMAPGSVEGRPAILAFDRDDPGGPPSYFVLLTFDEGAVLTIRDFRYARYVMTDATWERD
ncbi:sigma-70 family RNA polymerase sigma factor [Bauldia sp.]|uniref:sigma-70 family RNA polymerase sigma factor n=1 Tax=Bauldia sp. TaxID=2575872 RepID=UPI003BAC59C9